MMAVLSVLGAGCASGGSLGASEISHQSQSLQSLAAEGTLLAQDSASGRTTGTFVSEHASQLYRAATQAEAMLRGATAEPGLESERRKLLVLAGRVSAALKLLANASPIEDRVLAREFQSIQRVAGLS
jgi:hypothetical protein